MRVQEWVEVLVGAIISPHRMPPKKREGSAPAAGVRTTRSGRLVKEPDRFEPDELPVDDFGEDEYESDDPEGDRIRDDELVSHSEDEDDSDDDGSYDSSFINDDDEEDRSRVDTDANEDELTGTETEEDDEHVPLESDTESESDEDDDGQAEKERGPKRWADRPEGEGLSRKKRAIEPRAIERPSSAPPPSKRAKPQAYGDSEVVSFQRPKLVK